MSRHCSKHVFFDRNTYFGAACVHAFSGIASDPINNLVQVSSFMSLMYLSLQNQIQEDYRKDVERIRLETPGDQEPVYPQPANQNPVFLVPIGTSRKQTALYSVAYKCSEPPSPIQLKVRWAWCLHILLPISCMFCRSPMFVGPKCFCAGKTLLLTDSRLRSIVFQ